MTVFVIIAFCAIYFWAFVHLHTCTGMKTVKAVVWVICELFIVFAFMVVISEGVIWELVFSTKYPLCGMSIC